MAKSYGGIRVVGVVTPNGITANWLQFQQLLATGLYDTDRSYFSRSGAYVLYQRGHRFHPEEIEAAEAMADHGINVKLTSEGGHENITATSSKGNNKYSEGRVGLEELTFEQSTPSTPPSPDRAAKAVNKALEHAKKKRSEVAVLYDRNGFFHRTDIDAGIKEYEKHQSNTLRFKAILVISKDKKVYEWTHN